MISYEPTICCEGQDCTEMYSGPNGVQPTATTFLVMTEAMKKGWVCNLDGDFCPECVKLGRHHPKIKRELITL